MIISTFSACLHLAAGEVNSRNRVAADILQMRFIAATVWLVSGASSLFSDLQKEEKRGEKKGGGDLWRPHRGERIELQRRWKY